MEESDDPFAAVDQFDADIQESNVSPSSGHSKGGDAKVDDVEDDDLLRQVRELTMSLKKTQRAKTELQRKLSKVQTSQVEQKEELQRIRTAPRCKVVPKVMRKDPDLCWEFNSKGGCKNSNCQWKHVKYPTYSIGRGKDGGKGTDGKTEDGGFQPFGGADIMKKVLEDNKRLGMGHKYGAPQAGPSASGKGSSNNRKSKSGADQRKKGRRYEEALRLKAGINASRDLDVCWEFNSWSGCSKDREWWVYTLWIHNNFR